MTLPYQGQCQVSITIRLSFKLYLHLVKGHDRLWNKASSTRKYYTLKSNLSQFFITCVHGSYTFLCRFIQDELSFFPHVAEYDACNSSRTAPTSLSVKLACTPAYCDHILRQSFHTFSWQQYAEVLLPFMFNWF